MITRSLVGGSIVVALALTLCSSEASNNAASSPGAPPPAVLGVFEGRTPCGEVAVEFTGFPAQNCEKIKWRLILNQEPTTGRPTTYRYDGTRTRREGTWAIVRGTATDPDAVVYRLNNDDGARSIEFLKVDDNILLLLDSDRKLVVGDASWSYTLSRTDRMPND